MIFNSTGSYMRLRVINKKALVLSALLSTSVQSDLLVDIDIDKERNTVLITLNNNTNDVIKGAWGREYFIQMEYKDHNDQWYRTQGFDPGFCGTGIYAAQFKFNEPLSIVKQLKTEGNQALLRFKYEAEKDNNLISYYSSEFTGYYDPKGAYLAKNDTSALRDTFSKKELSDVAKGIVEINKYESIWDRWLNLKENDRWKLMMKESAEFYLSAREEKPTLHN